MHLRPDSVGNAYPKMDDNTAKVPLHFLEATQRRYLLATKEFAQLEGVYLEIGPDIGLATEIAVASGNLTQVVLVEPNQASRPLLKKVAPAINTVILDSITELDDSIRVDR